MARRINVLDISHHQSRAGIPNSKFPALKAAGIYAVIHKASEGLNYVDPFYADRQKAARDAGLLWGAYHFMNSTNAKDQADHFMNLVTKSSDFQPHMVACDYEDNLNGGSASLQQCMTFMRAVDSTIDGVQSVLYSGNRIRETLRPPRGGHAASDMGGVVQFFQDRRLWLAEYNPRYRVPFPWSEPYVEPKPGDAAAPEIPGVWLWQFTEKGKVPAIGDIGVDGNFFDGSFEQLQARWLA